MITIEEFASIVSRRVRLRKVGGRFVGLCPFHQEKHESFNLFRGRNGRILYKCFSCGEHGDVIDWIRQVEHQACQFKLDPELKRAVALQKRSDKIIREFRDRNPDSPVPDWIIKI